MCNSCVSWANRIAQRSARQRFDIFSFDEQSSIAFDTFSKSLIFAVTRVKSENIVSSVCIWCDWPFESIVWLRFKSIVSSSYFNIPLNGVAINESLRRRCHFQFTFSHSDQTHTFQFANDFSTQFSTSFSTSFSTLSSFWCWVVYGLRFVAIRRRLNAFRFVARAVSSESNLNSNILAHQSECFKFKLDDADVGWAEESNWAASQ